MKVNKRIIQCVAFLIVLTAVVLHLQSVFALDNEPTYMRLTGFSKEGKGKLDAVCIGGSETHCFWNSMFAWENHGIAGWSYCCNSMRPVAVKYYLAEALKRQPNAVYIISINVFKNMSNSGMTFSRIHSAVDYMPLGANRFQLTRMMLKDSDFTGLDRLEFYLPIIRFHSRWDALSSWSLDESDVDYKGSHYTEKYMEKATDVSGLYRVYDADGIIDDNSRAVVEDLLDFCDAHRLNVLFVKVPQSVGETEQGYMNDVQRLVSDRGYPCLDLMNHTSDMNLDLREDFLDKTHMNAHGAMKVAITLGDYLVEHYGFKDKRGLPEWTNWDRSARNYKELTDRYLLPFERDRSPRILTGIPSSVSAKAKGQDVTLSWEGLEGVDGYIIYRKTAKEPVWQEVAQTNAESGKWKESDLSPQTSYSYKVVPYVMSDGERAYGSFDLKSISVKTGGKA